MEKKAVVFDMDECIGSFWSLWPFYDIYLENKSVENNKLFDFIVKYILPSCLRPNINIVFKFLYILKTEKKIGNVFIYTNNGNYQTVKEKRKDKMTFAHFCISLIQRYCRTPGLFDLILETVFIRKKDAKNNIKKKYISDIVKHGYKNLENIIIFDDHVSVWREGGERVVKVPEFKGGSHSFLRIKSLTENLTKTIPKLKTNKLDSNLEQLLKDETYFPTDPNDNISMTIVFPRILKFLF